MAVKDMTVSTEGKYLSLSNPDMMEIITENIGGGEMSALDLPRIKIPSGGGTHWSIPSAEGDKSVPSFNGIIAYWTTMRAYWEKSFDETGGGAPPECSSQDGVYGIGSPGGECMICPLNKFGSDNKQKGKACREVRANFVLLEDAQIPMVYMAPTMSIKPEKDYFMQLAASGIVYSEAETKFSLEQDKSGTGIKYSKGVPTLSRRLTTEEIISVKGWKNILKNAAKTVTVNSEDAYGGEE